MKKVIIMFALAMGIVTANAQENVTVGENNGSEQPTLTKEVYPQKEADGDLYHGLTRKLGFDRMVPPHGLEVTYDKTVHVIFPSEVRYVDLGSPDLIAGKADGAENVIRVKATVRNFPNETNMSVITEDGSFYTFNVKYASEPLLLNVEMCDFIHDGEKVNRPNNAQEIYLKELGSESPMLVRLIMKSIHKQNKREVKHIGCKRFGIQYLLKGIYTHNGLLYFHTEIKNQSNVPFDVDYITWKIVDKKVAKRTAVSLTLASCDDDMDIQQSYPFTVETMPVPNKVTKGQTVEIRCELKKTGDFANTLYTIRYFQFEGEGTLKMAGGITFLPNDRYLLENDKFRLYYTADGDEAHNFIVVVEDNFKNSYELEFDFNNRNVKDDIQTVIPIGNYKPLPR